MATCVALIAGPALAQVVASGEPPAISTGAQPVGPTAGDNEIKARLDGTAAPTAGGEKLHRSLLQQFYAAHEFQPVWPTHQKEAQALLAAVARSGEHGLDPELFHGALLRNAAALAPIDRELLLSDAFLAYADALARGALPQERRMDDEDLAPEPIAVAAVLDNAIASPDPATVIEALAPSSPDYLALRRALQAYRRGAAEVAPDAARHPHPAVATDKAGAAGDDERLRKIEVALERQRWLPRHLPSTRIWVNLPNAQLVLYQHDQPVFTTRVVIGQNDWQTPELQTQVTSLLFNPPWNVPPSIAQEEILPKVSRDPGYLARHHMVYRPNGAIQQLPGHGTALGRLKFEMPNRFDVYLHDTPLKTLFSRDNRRQSHGCVRVQNPQELGALLLRQPVETITKAIAPGTTTRRMLPEAVPVFFVYQTAFVGPGGAIEFRPDVYDRDREVWQQLHPLRQPPVAQREGSQRKS